MIHQINHVALEIWFIDVEHIINDNHLEALL